MALDRDTWATGFGLIARGATGVIDDRIFVAIVVMALATSLLAGPMMNRLLSHRVALMPSAPREVELESGAA